MLSRGKYIGEIIDLLAQLEASAKLRSKLGLFDINKYCEDMFKDLLNILLGTKLINLNSERHNYPGLDLGDRNSKIAFQVTVDKSGAKIVETLQKMTTDDISTYTDVNILVIGKKQATYSILTEPLCTSRKFTANNIWDIQDLSLKIMALEIDKLMEVYEFSSKQLVRLITEFSDVGEDHDDSDSWTTKIERAPGPIISNFERLIEWQMKKYKLSEEDCASFRVDIPKFINSVKELPRVSRDFLSVVIERSKYVERFHRNAVHYDDLVRRSKTSVEKIDHELAFLEQYNHLYIHRNEDELADTYIVLTGVVKEEYLISGLQEFCSDENVSMQTLIRDLDFTPLGK